MSKITDAMRRAMRREARPIGFATTSSAANATMLVVARPGTDKPEAVAKAGADAVLLAEVSKNGLLWGSEAPIEGARGTKTLRDAGCDFVVFDADTTAAAALLEDGLGYIMRVDLDASEALLRGIEGLPLDAVLVPALGGALTVRRTLDLRRLVAFVRKPVIVPVDAGITAAELEALRDCGVIGVVVEGAAGAKALRVTVDKLAPRKRNRDGRGISIGIQARGDSYEVEELPEPDDEP